MPLFTILHMANKTTCVCLVLVKYNGPLVLYNDYVLLHLTEQYTCRLM